MLKKLGTYAKVTDRMEDLDFALQEIMKKQAIGNMFITTEPNRGSYKLDKIKNAMTEDDVCVIANLASFIWWNINTLFSVFLEDYILAGGLKNSYRPISLFNL